MSEPGDDEDFRKWHRRFAAAGNNRGWRLSEGPAVLVRPVA